MIQLRRVAFWICLSMFLAGSVRAALVSFEFEGVVTSSNKTAVFPIGQSVVGTYTFESTTPDTNPGNPEQGDYTPAVTSFSFGSGSYSGTATVESMVNGGGTILVNRDTVFDPHQYEVYLQRAHVDPFPQPRWGPDVGGEQLVRMRVVLRDDDEMAITDIALPVTPPNLSDFTSVTFGLIFELDPTNSPGVVFTLTALTLNEPVGGAVTGLASSFFVACINRTTGQTVTAFVVQDTKWDCEAEGLEVLPGDVIFMIEAGIAE